MIREYKGEYMPGQTGREDEIWTWRLDRFYGGGQLLAGDRQSWRYTQHTSIYYGGERHYHLDHLGSVRMVSDSDGRSLSLDDYYPFGASQTKAYQEEVKEGEIDRMRFAGHTRDFLGLLNTENSEYLDNMHARHYDAHKGRFLSVDPTWASADLGRPQSWNRYGYVMNNPVNMTDPDGKCPQSLTGRPCANPLNGTALVIRREKHNPINGEFGMTRNQGKTPHQGLDLLSTKGTPVTAADGGRVVTAGVQNGHGNIVIIAHQNAEGADVSFTSYSHLDSMSVKRGETVESGQKIGEVGRSGNLSAGIPTHLHFEIRKEQEPGKGEAALAMRVDPAPELRLDTLKELTPP